ncbi:natriuretic peptides A-like [Sceloporus undulatus]|uniref:natriuretic peptides A-like n=1 Tax=Sceloporus undulatus TaxID=8520 RepID=UPI001C4B46E2|nr:natriuretic peptides A-like [Sceloporus undulatus]
MGSLVVLFILVAVAQLHGKANAHLHSGSELAELKDLLEHLEDKLGEREAEFVPGFNEPDDAMAGDASQNVADWDNQDARPMSQGGIERGNWQPPERVATTRSKFRGLFNAPRSLQRSSGCFGQRMDRIGASSGLGCRRNRN